MAERNVTQAMAALKLAETARAQALEDAANAIEHDAPHLAARIRAMMPGDVSQKHSGTDPKKIAA